MPGYEQAYVGYGPDLFPQSEEEHGKLLAWCQRAFTSAQSAKREKENRWRKYHRIYRSWVEEQTNPTWRNQTHIPYAFTIVESITPRLVAQLPRFICEPVGPEDVIPAKLMEGELTRAANVTSLHVDLVMVIKTGLKFGTGILKTYYQQDVRHTWEQVPVMEQVPVTTEEPLDAAGATVVSLDGEPQMTTRTEMVEQPKIDPETGEPVMTWQKVGYLAYAGPKATWVDPFHFWVAPEATNLDDARYTIERFYRTVEYMEQKIAQGIYRLPPGVESVEETAVEDEGIDIRAQETGEGGFATTDDTRAPVELLEFHTDDNRVITVLNRKAIVRVAVNPHAHNEKPYAVFPNYVQEGEFWGVGEIEAIEQLQDLVNAIYNQRIDNVRLTMNAMFAVNTRALEDERDLLIKPGGVIRVAGDWLPEEAIKRIEMGDVTGSAFAEAQQVEQLIERTSGIGGYQLGMTEEGQNKTATGVSLITAEGASKFALKVRLVELIGMRRVARHWGSMIQQYMDEQRTVRVLGPNGQWLFATMTPDSIQGGLDYTIDVGSTTQTEAAQKEQSLLMFQTLAPVLPQAIPALAQDVLEAHGKKDYARYLTGGLDVMTLMTMMEMQANGGMLLPMPPQAMAGMGMGADPNAPGSPQTQDASQQEAV